MPFLSKSSFFQNPFLTLLLPKLTTWPLGWSEMVRVVGRASDRSLCPRVLLWVLAELSFTVTVVCDGDAQPAGSTAKGCAGFSLTPELPLLPLLCPSLSLLSPATQKEPIRACLPSTVHRKPFAYPLRHMRATGRSLRKLNAGSAARPLGHCMLSTVGWPLPVGLLPQEKMGKHANRAPSCPLTSTPSVFSSTYHLCLQPQAKISTSSWQEVMT